MPTKYNAHDLYAVITRVGSGVLHAPQVFAWRAKVDYIAVTLEDLPNLERAVVEEEIRSMPAEKKPGVVWFPDGRPTVRLAMALEMLTHAVYAAADISAQVASKAANAAKKTPTLPAHFSEICRAVERGKLPADLVYALGDLTWYWRVREIRTEWAHYSAPFVGSLSMASEDDRSFRLYEERRTAERVHFTMEPAMIHIDELTQWTRSAITTTSNLAGYVLERFVLPSLNLNELQWAPMYRDDGAPLLTSNGRFEMRQTSVRELLGEVGIPR